MAEESNHYTYRMLCLVLLSFFISDRVVSSFASAIRDETPSYLLIACLVVAMFLLGAIVLTCLPLSLLPMSRFHSFPSGIKHFYLQILLYFIGRYRWRLMENSTKNPRKYQDAFLINLLRKNANTEYGKLMGFKNISDRENYRQMVPLSDYETYQPYIDRVIKKGEQNLMTSEPVVRFNVSSGTTGNCKMLPIPADGHKHLLWNFYLPVSYKLNTLKSSAFLAPVKTAMLMMLPRWRYTHYGLPMGPSSALSEKDKMAWVVLSRTLPVEAEIYLSEQGQCYLQWLFALFDPELGRIDGTFAGSFLSALNVLEKNWQVLVADIRYGRITDKYDIPTEIIDRIESKRIIEACPRRADFIEKECSKGFKSIIKRLWPRITTISCAITGPHAVHRRKLEWYCGKRVRITSLFIMASEGLIGINMDGPAKFNGEDDQFYTLPVESTFMEFIPEDDITKKDPETLFMDELERGKRYEIVVTSMVGIYRYRLGDIIEVVRHRHGRTPVVKFCARVGSLLDMIGEKTSEDMVHLALEKASKRWKRCHGLVDFATTESLSWAKVFPPPTAEEEPYSARGRLFYVIFVEADGISRELTAHEIVAFDEALCQISYPYKSFRLKSSLAMPKVITVINGTFDKLKTMALDRNKAVSNQYKTPRYIKDETYLEILAAGAFPNKKTAVNKSWF